MSIDNSVSNYERSNVVDRRNFLYLVGLSPFVATSIVQEAEAQTRRITTREGLYERLFESQPLIQAPDSQYDSGRQEVWRRRYNGNDPQYDSQLRAYKRRTRQRNPDVTLKQELLQGWGRLYNSSDLQFVYDECLRQGVPFELVFLALAESHWDNRRSRVGANGHWQFMPATARAYGLEVNGRIDERLDVRESTPAGIKYLRDLYNQNAGWPGIRGNRNVTTSDRWAWAFWSYNRGPGRVRRAAGRLNGDASGYAYYMRRANRESAEYVNKIFGIRLALMDLLVSDGVPAEPVRLAGRTEADRLFETFRANEANMSLVERFTSLDRVRELYEADRASSAHTAEYITSAFGVIDQERANLRGQLTINTAVVEVNGVFKSEADRLYDEFIASGQQMNPQERLRFLQGVKQAYQSDLESRIHSDVFVNAAVDIIDQQMAEVMTDNANVFASTATNNVATGTINVERGGELVARVERRGQTIEAEVTDYTVQPGDNLTYIATRLSGDANNRGIVTQMITDLNPEITNLNLLRRGQEIRVPGQYIEVPRVSLRTLVEEYYPNQPVIDAERYIKWMNGKNPDSDLERDKIRPGQIMLVPIL